MNITLRSNYLSGSVLKKAFVSIFALLNLIFFFPGTAPAQLDPAFGTNGVAATNVGGVEIANYILPDGKIFVICDYYSTPVRFARFNSDGTPDMTYGTGGVVEPVMPFINQSNGIIYAAARQPDGKILLAGDDNGHSIITRINENGTVDTGFAENGVDRFALSGGIFDGFWSIILQPDGKIVGVGRVRDSSGESHKIFLIRYSANGVLDATFGGGHGYVIYPDIISSQGLVEMKVLLQSDGKFLVFRKLIGEFEGSARVSRYNTDGTLDNTYPTIPLHGSLSKLTLQPDDKLLLAGAVNKTDALLRQHKDISVRRYTTAGTLDPGFGTGGISNFDMTTNFDDTSKELLVMPDGQILVSVLTTVPLNRSALRGYKLSLARLSADGNTVTGKFIQTDMAPPIPEYHLMNKNSLLTRLPDGKILTISHIGESNAPNLILTRALDVPVVTYKFHGTPGDFNYAPFGPSFNPFGPKVDSEPTVFRPDTQKWYSYGVPNGFPTFGLSGDIPVPSDYIGDFGTEFAVFRPSNGTWYIAKTQINPGTNFIEVRWGQSGDIPVPGDFDGDGKSDPAVYRPSNGGWYITFIANGSYAIHQWGINGDKPAVGDFDGDGKADLAVFRPSDGNWYIARSSDGGYTILHWGADGDIPVQEDYDGDGKTDIAVFRPSDGNWYILRSSDGSFFGVHWGTLNDIPAPADYDGDYKADFAIWRPSGGRWYIYRSLDNSITDFAWGSPTDIPVQGKN